MVPEAILEKLEPMLYLEILDYVPRDLTILYLEIVDSKHKQVEGCYKICVNR